MTAPAGDDSATADTESIALVTGETGTDLVEEDSAAVKRRWAGKYNSPEELRWEDVDGSWLHVRRRFYRGAVGLPKGRRKRDVPLSRDLAQALWQLPKESHAGPDELVFTSVRGERIIPSNLMSRVLKPAGRTAGVGDWIGFHTFRHTAATMLFRRGWNAVQVQKFLGHSDPGFTLRTYVHLLPEDLPDVPFTLLRAEPVPASDAVESDKPVAGAL